MTNAKRGGKPKGLTVLLPKFRTLQFKYVVLSTRAVIFLDAVLSKKGPRFMIIGSTSSSPILSPNSIPFPSGFGRLKPEKEFLIG